MSFRNINEKVNKANSIAGLIRSFVNLDQEGFRKLFTAMVRPHLEYTQSVWSSYWLMDIVKIENVQRRATKQIPGLTNMSYTERLQALKLPSLAYRLR